jgi:hypothetical protein
MYEAWIVLIAVLVLVVIGIIIYYAVYANSSPRIYPSPGVRERPRRQDINPPMNNFYESLRREIDSTPVNAALTMDPQAFENSSETSNNRDYWTILTYRNNTIVNILNLCRDKYASALQDCSSSDSSDSWSSSVSINPIEERLEKLRTQLEHAQKQLNTLLQNQYAYPNVLTALQGMDSSIIRYHQACMMGQEASKHWQSLQNYLAVLQNVQTASS